MFLGRKKELDKLNRMWKRDKFEMAVVYGRRRVGKTTLIKEFCKGKRTVFFASSETPSYENLQEFSRIIAMEKGGKGSMTYNSFRDLLEEIGQMAVDERMVVVIDEYPYLAKSEPSFSSLLQNFIDSNYKETKLFLILCGSSMSFMEHQVLGYQSPLFGRRTAQFKIEPFNYYETALWFPEMSNPERALIYGITGGIPLYVELMTGYDSVRDAMLSEIFNDNAYLYEEPGNLLKQELREPQNYNAIITAIAEGSSRMNEVSTKVGLDSATCSKYINKMIELGILHKEKPLGENSSKKVYYRIVDQMFRFWYRFVASNVSAIVSGRIERTFSAAVEDHLNHYMGSVFEDMVKQYLLFRDEYLPIDMGEIGQWWGTHNVDKKQVQIDIVVLSPDNKSVILGECKYRNEPVDMDTLKHLKHAAEAFPDKSRKVYYYLFSKTGFTERLIQYANDNGVRLVTFDEMMPNNQDYKQ